MKGPLCTYKQCQNTNCKLKDGWAVCSECFMPLTETQLKRLSRDPVGRLMVSLVRKLGSGQVQ